jgi:hypothetical protein
MNRADMDVIYSPSAKQIEAYCHTLAQELSLTLAYAEFRPTLWPDHTEDRFHLMISITSPLSAIAEFWYTREQVLGYATGESKVAIQSGIRQDLETRLRARGGEQMREA